MAIGSRLPALAALLATLLVGCASPIAAAPSPAAPSAGPSAPSPSGVPPASDPPSSASSPAESSGVPGAPSPATPSPAAPSPTAPSPAPDLIPVVPVTDWRSTADAVFRSDVAAVLAGTGRWAALELVAAEADAVLARLDLERPADPARLVLAPDAAALRADLAARRDRLGFLDAAAVDPSVRALGWGRRSLFGVDRVSSRADWALWIAPPPDTAADGSPGTGSAGGGSAGGDATAGSSTPASFDPAALWTMWAGGDLGLDRQVAHEVTVLGKGVDWPFDGGTVRITGTTCCSKLGWPQPVIVSTGSPGAVRALIAGADLAVANLEEPAPDDWTYHPHGTVFTGNPALLAGIARAGIDVVSMASNHVGDGGRDGVLETMTNLDTVGIRHFGAGPNLAAARKPAVFEVGGTAVAILGVNAIPPSSYFATATLPGSAPLVGANLEKDIAAARAAGAELVVVYPHWGTEYTFGPTAFQRSMAHLAIDAGADLVIGNHPHWVQSIEVYRGRPIWYALGNYTFDQSWSEPTMEGISLELTFRGATLVQARMHPHVSLIGVQPNLLDPTSARRVLDPVFTASGSLLPW